VGLHAQDTAELIFEDARVPAENLLGEEGKGFYYLMDKLQQERLVVSIAAQTAAETMLQETISYVKQREAFGKPISKLQTIQFRIAEMATEIEVGRSFLNDLIEQHIEGKEVTTKVSMSKWWHTEMARRVITECMQLHGGYGYMEEYEIARFASMRLGDLGAEVIKVEPLTGDLSRTAAGDSREKDSVFHAYNRNKQSIAVNLKTEEGLEMVRDLIQHSDVVIESFRPGVMQRLGLDYEAVSQWNPEVIYCSLSGYGQEGRLSGFGSHDINYLALSGILSQLKDRTGRPVHPTVTLADLIGSLAANESILAAYISRERTGEGAYIDSAILDSMLSLTQLHTLNVQYADEHQGLTSLNGDLVSYSIYETADNRFVSFAALEPKFWKTFCHEVGRKDWGPHQFEEKDTDNPFVQELEQMFKSKTFQQWEEFSSQVDCCLTPIYEMEEVLTKPYVKERMIQEKNQDGIAHLASRYQTKDVKRGLWFPDLGEQSEGILSNLLCYSEEKIQDMKKRMIIL